MMNRIARWVNRNMPTRDALANSRYLKPIAHRILPPELWRFTRRSVPRGVALGLLVGIVLLIPGVQIAGAALLALPCRANIPIAAVTTFLSNPLTTPLIVAASIFIGNNMLGRNADVSMITTMLERHASIGEWLRWLYSDAAPAMLIGLFTIGVVSAAIGYLLASWFWRWRIGHKWRRRGIRKTLES